MAKLITIEITLKDEKAVCSPSHVNLSRTDPDPIQWFSKDGDHDVTFQDPAIQFNSPRWVGKKGSHSDPPPGVLLPSSKPGKYMPKVILKDPASGAILNPKGGGPDFQVG